MKKITLEKMVLTNFKGIKHFELDASGQDTKVNGDNGTGKTTLFDGFVWVLFDKDSQNKKDFEIKTLINGKPVSMLDHSVEVELKVDGQPLALKKVYKEKWTKKRGAATSEFTGHTTDYFVNGVPAKKKEFMEAVAGFVDEDTFKLLTNPNYFNEHMHWKDRRELLLEIAGDVTDEQVIASNKNLADLLNVLNGRSIEDHKKIIAAKRKEINAELDRIPIRIDEINRGLPDLPGLTDHPIHLAMDIEEVQKQIDQLDKQIDLKREQINDIRSGGEFNKLRARISEVDFHTANVRNDHVRNEQQQVFSLKTRLQEEQSNLGILQSKKRDAEYRLSRTQETIQNSQDNLASLRRQWEVVGGENFSHTDACECPTCGQELPDEQIDAARTKAEAAFNLEKSNKLEDIKLRGTKGAEHLKQLENEADQHEKEISKLDGQLAEKQQEISKLQVQISKAETAVSPLDENVTYKNLIQEKHAIEQQITSLQHSVDDSVQAVQTEVEAIKDQQKQLQENLNKLTLVQQSRERLAELEQQEKKLAGEFEELERQLFMAEDFIRTKVDLVTEKINGKFKFTRFNLFKENINGGLEETCEATYDGVPYGSGLNNAARINVGLDIINTLSEHYGVQAPIFVDNSEGVSDFPDMGAQLIRLIKPPRFRDLNIDAREALAKEHGSYEEAEKDWNEKYKQLRIESQNAVKEAI